MLTTAYADSGYVYLYLTCNANPGGIQVVKASLDGTSLEVSDLYIPDAEDQQFCICSVTVDAEGSIYYKNDSGKVFKIGVSQAALDAEAAEPVIALIEKIGDPRTSAMEITNARKAYDALTEDQKACVTNYDKLTAAEQALRDLPHADLDKMLTETGDMLERDFLETAPQVGSIGGEWAVIGLARSDRQVSKDYYGNVVSFVERKINDKEQLHRAKSTENSRIILALTALGLNVTDVDGHNLLQGLTDMNYLKRQGNNGPIWALIAFDSYDYEIPTVHEGGEQVTREGLIDYILSVQLPDGGWTLSNDPDSVADADMTGMALQALAPYYRHNDAVTEAVDKALATVSEIQLANGGFASWGTVNVESCAQILVALNALGIDAVNDERFVKNGRTILDAVSDFYVDGGGFRHLYDQEGMDAMATEQSYYAMVATKRMRNSLTSLYDMTDVYMLPFQDVANDAWFRENVIVVTISEVMNGSDENHFNPYGIVTRGQLMTTLYRCVEVPESDVKLPFTDVAEDRYYYEPIRFAYEYGIAKGVNDTTFQPGAAVSRAQMAVFLLRMTQLMELDNGERADLTAFEDADLIPAYAADAMAWAVANGLLTGVDETHLDPAGDTSRGQYAAVLCRTAELWNDIAG